MIRKNSLKFILLSVISILILQACSILSSGSREDFAIPGCERAWKSIDNAKTLNDLKILIVNNCSELYEQGWRLTDKRFKRKVINPELCKESWNKLQDAKQLDKVKFMVLHNCPVLYRHGWIVPPN